MNPWVELIELIWTLLWMSDLSAGSSTRGGRTTSKERANSRYCRKTPTTMALTSGESQGVLENDLIEFHRTCRASYLAIYAALPPKLSGLLSSVDVVEFNVAEQYISYNVCDRARWCATIVRLTEIIRASSGFGVMKKLALLEQHQRGGRDSSHGFASAKAVSSSTRESRNNGDPNDVDEAASSAGSSDAVSEPAIDPPPPAAASSSRVSERSHGRERERDRDRDRDRDIVRRSTVMNPRAFPLRLYDVLSSPDNTYLQWTLEGDAFMIKNEEGGGISDMLRRRFKSTFRCFVPVCR